MSLQSSYKQTSIGEILGEWKVVRVNDVFEVYGGTTPSTTKKDYWDGSICWVTPTDATKSKNKLLKDTEKKVTEKAVKETSLRILNPGTLLLTSRATIGYTVINSVPVTINQGMTALIKKNNDTDSVFYAYFFEHRKKYLEQLGSGSTFKEVSRSILKKLKIPLPPLAEQQKIAEILSTVDKAIQKVDDCIAKTQRLKQGLMQKLLTLGIGHKKFKYNKELGCEIPEEWKVMRLGSVSLNFINGGTPSTYNPDYWDGDVPWMTSAHISGRIVMTGQRYITKEGLKNSATNLVPKDNLLVATRVGIGKAAINKIDIAISQDLTGVIIDKNKAIPEFVYWIFINSERKLKSLAQGSTIKGILREELGKLKIPLPPLSEQHKIAEILNTVDKKLDLEKKRKEKLERIKRGLMNDLLTGRKRVKLDEEA